MDSFLASAQEAAASHAPVSFADLDAALSSSPSHESTKELLYGLVDAYGTSDDGTYRQAIIEGLGRCLAFLLQQQHRPVPASATADAVLTPDDLLMLALFFNELATVTHPTLCCTFAGSLAPFYQLAAPVAYGVDTDDSDGKGQQTALAEEECETRASIRTELAALRQVIAKRLGTPAGSHTGPAGNSDGGVLAVGASRSQAVPRAALDCLMSMLRTQLAVLRRQAASTGGGAALAEEVKDTAEGLLGPLRTVLEEQQQQQQLRNPGQASLQHGAGSAAALARDAAGRAHGAPTIPATLITSVLAYVEEVLWCAEQQCDGAGASPAAVTAAGVFRHTVSTLLGHVQRYLALQQHRQMELAATASGAEGTAGSSAQGGRGETVVDVMRLYSVQHAVQRVLSVATTAAASVHHGKAGEREAEAVRLLTATLSNGLQAALAAFGGPVTVQAPPPVKHDAAATTTDHGTWQLDTPHSRVQRSGNVLGSVPGMDAEEMPSGAEDDEDGDGAAYLDEDEDALLLGAGREPLLKSSAGPVTAAALADMVMQSVAALDRAMVTKENLRVVHLQGLEEMQHQAARRAQREELERQRLMEQQGVEAIPATKLLENVRDSVNIQARGMATLRRVTARAVLEKAAFTSVLRSYAYVKEESEATVRAAQALIGRCLVQMPQSMADAALDAVFVQLQSEFKKEQKLRQASNGRTPANSLVAQMHSYYQLMLQVLFTFAAAQAPIQERGGINPLLLYADASVSGSGVPAGVNAHMTSHARFVVDTENPIAFLQDESTHTPSYLTSAAMAAGGSAGRTGTRHRRGAGGRRGRARRRRQRARREGDGTNGAEADSDGDEGASSGSSADESQEDGVRGSEDDDDGDEDTEEENQFFFLNDTARSPCPYSHVLCRLIELAESCKLEVILLDVLLQAPMLTRYVWNYIYRRLCLSTTNQERCNMGFLLLSGLATRRPVYRTCAVNLLLHLCMSRNDYARRVAIISVGRLLSITTSAGHPVVPADVETSLVRYAKKQLAAVPGYQFATVLRTTREAGATTLDETTIAALQAEEDKKAQEVLGRHLGLFLKLCARQPRSLFSTLLDVYKQCVERNNEVMVRLLPANKDVQAMTEVLLESDPAGFMFAVVPFLRRYSADATLFVQSLLWTIGNKLRSLCAQAKSAAPDEGRSTDTYRTVALGMLEHARAMYDMSRIPLGRSGGTHRAGRGRGGDAGYVDEDLLAEDDAAADAEDGEDDGFVLNDARFLAPFFSLVPAAELKQKYLPAFLYFVQVQLQFQRFYKQQQQQQQQQQGPGASGSGAVNSGSLAITLLSAKERSYVLTHEELKQFIALVVREVLVKAPFTFDDGAPRGLSPVEFFVYLHRLPQETMKASSMDTGNTGYLGSSGAGGDGDGGTSATTPPIGIVTTKEVVSVCLELSRTFTFDGATTGTPKLYGPEEVQRALKRMMHPPPVPSQIMATVLQSVSALYPRGTRYAVVKEFLHFVVVNVLTPLERASAWETDQQLWKGVQLFLEKFYGECSGFMVNLPDQVLIQALREHPRLTEKFREEHGNNASFAHILGNL